MNKRHTLFFLFLNSFILLLLISFFAQSQSTLESVPNQKLINNSYVSNPDNILDQSTVAQIDTLLASLESKTTVQVAVVVVNSIGDADVFDFAQQLFEKWGIGSKGNDNGLLLLLVKDVHTVRFHTGYGLEGVLPDITCKRIQREYMVPEFRNDNYNAGILAGLQQVDKILANPEYSEELKEPEVEIGELAAFIILASVVMGLIVVPAFFIKNMNGHFANSKHPKQTLYREMRLPRWWWVTEFIVMPGFIVLFFGLKDDITSGGDLLVSLYLYFMLTLFHRLVRVRSVIDRLRKKQQYYEITEFIRKGQPYWFFMALFFPFPFIFYFIYHLYRKRWYRNHSRACAKCQGNMKKLAESEEDPFLHNSQQMEETLHSADYDVWRCDSCQNTQSWVYPNRRSKYKACPKCKTLAYYFVSSRTIHAATYSSSGEGEEIHSCKFCGHTKRETYSIAQLVHSTSSDSSSSDSSSSSSGGSWGGGSSGGGGASSSW